MNKKILIVLVCVLGMQSLVASQKVIRVEGDAKIQVESSMKSKKRVAKPKTIQAPKVKVTSKKSAPKAKKVKVVQPKEVKPQAVKAPKAVKALDQK